MKVETMYCPLMSIGDDGGYSPCIRGLCAWWNHDNRCCSMVNIVQKLDDLNKG